MTAVAGSAHRGLRLHLRARSAPAVTAGLLTAAPVATWAAAHLRGLHGGGGDHPMQLLAPALAAVLAVRVLHAADPVLEGSTARARPGPQVRQVMAIVLVAPLLVALTVAVTGHGGEGAVLRNTVGGVALAVIAGRAGPGVFAGLPAAAYLAAVHLTAPITAGGQPPATRAAAVLTWPVRPATDHLAWLVVAVLAGAAVAGTAVAWTRPRPRAGRD